MVPSRLTDWTYESLVVLCEAGGSESDRHDFKRGLPGTQNTTKICCAFANTFGGFLVVGVRDEESIFSIEGLEPDNEMYKRLLDQVQAEPDIGISLPKMIAIPDSERVIYVFEIPQSTRRPHLPSKAEERFFWKRQGSKCERMTLEEVRYQMNSYEEKREKLVLLMMELNHIIRSVTQQAMFADGEYDGSIFRFDIIDRVVVEAFSIIKSDQNIFGALDTLKKRLMSLNFEKEKLLGLLARGPLLQESLMRIASHRSSVQSLLPGIVILAQQVQRSLKDHYGIENPYEVSSGN